MLFKTLTGNRASLEALIAQHHSYTLPEIISVDISAGSAAFLAFLARGGG
jgi:uncharacterized protein involved in tolerance to divalent cations